MIVIFPKGGFSALRADNNHNIPIPKPAQTTPILAGNQG
jgi:hypothetical protein